MIPDAQGGEPSGGGMTVGGIAVPDEVVRRFIPRERFDDLLDDPLRRWMIGDAERRHPSSLVSQDDQDEQQPEADRRDHKEVHGGDTSRMIAKEGLPSLR